MSERDFGRLQRDPEAEPPSEFELRTSTAATSPMPSPRPPRPGQEVLMTGFTLSFYRDDPLSEQWSRGYWVAKSGRGNYDGIGADPIAALAALVNVLADALNEVVD